MSADPRTPPESLEVDPRLRELNVSSPITLKNLATSNLSASEYKVFHLVAASLTHDDWTFINQAELAEQLGMGRANFSRSLNRLVREGFIAKGPKQGRSPTYRISSGGGGQKLPKLVRSGKPKKAEPVKRDTTQSGPTSLYRHYDAAGCLLYIGISLSAFTRFAQHKHGSVWSANVTRMEIEHYASREAALRAERRAIQVEQPVWNVQHAPTIHE